jgi:hypothetical protein
VLKTHPEVDTTLQLAFVWPGAKPSILAHE